MKFKAMNTRERKVILKIIKEQWGCDYKVEHYFMLSPKDRIYLLNHDYDLVKEKKLRINTPGIYFAEYNYKRQQVRLSIEGSQIIGPLATKNVLDVSKEQFRDWLKGNDIPANDDCSGFVIVKSGKDYAGSGAFKEGNILNYVPKARRIRCAD